MTTCNYKTTASNIKFTTHKQMCISSDSLGVPYEKLLEWGVINGNRDIKMFENSCYLSITIINIWKIIFGHIFFLKYHNQFIVLDQGQEWTSKLNFVQLAVFPKLLYRCDSHSLPCLSGHKSNTNNKFRKVASTIVCLLVYTSMYILQIRRLSMTENCKLGPKQIIAQFTGA